MSRTRRWRRARAVPPAGWLVLASGAVLASASAPLRASQSWTTEPDFEIIGPSDSGTNGGFGRVGRVRVSRDGLRVHVVEPLARRITVLSPDGEILLRLEREEGLAGFGRPLDVRVLRDGFWATYERHFVRFSDNGSVLEMLESLMPGAETLLDDHTILARQRPPPPAVMLGWTEGEAAPEQAILRHAANHENRAVDTIAMLDVRRLALGIRFDDGTSPVPAAMFATQPFTDSDLGYLDGDGGIVGIVRRSGAPGLVAITEITARADTVWRRSLALPPVALRATQVEEAVRDLAGGAASSAQRMGRPISEATARRLAEEAVYVPEYLPAVAEARATASGELWLRSPEESGARRVWYAMRRHDDAAEPRRVLLPDWFQLLDATDTHVWGLRLDAESGVRVVGRRLVEGAGRLQPTTVSKTGPCRSCSRPGKVRICHTAVESVAQLAATRPVLHPTRSH